jgi:hypothetical protein
VQRIIGVDGKPDILTLNLRDETGKVTNDMTVGRFDVVMETGPGYNSKRQEAVAAMTPLLSGPNNKLMDVAGDLFFRNMDFPGADVIADRLAAMNPLSQIDEQSEIPPAVQIQIKQFQQQIQQLGQQLQAAHVLLKNRADIEGMREAAGTHRETIKQNAETMRKQLENETWVHEIATKATTAQNVEELKGIVQLLLKHIDTRQIHITAAYDDAAAQASADREDARLAAGQ